MSILVQTQKLQKKMSCKYLCATCVQNEDKQEAQHWDPQRKAKVPLPHLHSTGGLKYTCDVLQEARDAAGIYGSLL